MENSFVIFYFIFVLYWDMNFGDDLCEEIVVFGGEGYWVELRYSWIWVGVGGDFVIGGEWKGRKGGGDKWVGSRDKSGDGVEESGGGGGREEWVFEWSGGGSEGDWVVGVLESGWDYWCGVWCYCWFECCFVNCEFFFGWIFWLCFYW